MLFGRVWWYIIGWSPIRFFGHTDQCLTCEFFFSFGFGSPVPFWAQPIRALLSFSLFVMALQRRAVFKCGGFDSECSREDIAKAFFDAFSNDHLVESIQIVPGKVVKVCFGSSQSKTGVCSER